MKRNIIPIFVRKEPVGCVALLLTLVSLLWTVAINAEYWASGEIRSLIAAESRVSINRNPQEIEKIFCKDAVVRNWGSYSPGDQHPLESWSGIDEIQQRYRNLPQIKRIVHIDVDVHEIRILLGTARARSSSEGVILDGGLEGTSVVSVASVNGDIWEFRREGIPFVPWTGRWKIASFTYDCKE